MKKYFAAAALLVMTACGGPAVENKPLEGTQWKLSTMEGITAEAINKVPDFFTLKLNAADTMISGRTNCNRFFGKYHLDGKELEFSKMGMTRMACMDMQHETAFVNMLDQVDSYTIKGDELQLFNDQNDVLAVFTAVEPEAAPADNAQEAPVAEGEIEQEAVDVD